jgi:hypothetical protein
LLQVLLLFVCSSLLDGTLGVEKLFLVSTIHDPARISV